jgi:hypothetical protein
MTRYRRKKLKHIEEQWVAGKTLCDFCHKQVASNALGTDFDEVQLGAKLGDIWPEGDFRTSYRIDVCGKCFMAKVKPAIEALGVKWHEYPTESNYLNSDEPEAFVDDYERMDGTWVSEMEEKS